MYEILSGTATERESAPVSPGSTGYSGRSVASSLKRPAIEKFAAVVYRDVLRPASLASRPGTENPISLEGEIWPAEQTERAGAEEQRLTLTDKVLFIGVES